MTEKVRYPSSGGTALAPSGGFPPRAPPQRTRGAGGEFLRPTGDAGIVLRGLPGAPGREARGTPSRGRARETPRARRSRSSFLHDPVAGDREPRRVRAAPDHDVRVVRGRIDPRGRRHDLVLLAPVRVEREPVG